jgi:hypothetical protein
MTMLATLQARVRELEVKLVEAAAASERELDTLRAENTRLKGEVERLDKLRAEAVQSESHWREQAHALRDANTPLKERVAALEKQLAGAMTTWCPAAIDGLPTCKCGRFAIGDGRSRSWIWRENGIDHGPWVCGPTSDSAALRNPAGGPEQNRGAAALRPAGSHAFVPAPFYPDKCDAQLDDNGRPRTCTRPRAEHQS